MEAKGQKLLKVCGVLFIIVGIIGILVYGLFTLLLGYVTVKEGSSEGVIAVGASALQVVAAIVALIAGILGVKYAKNPAGAGKCLVWGCIYLVIALAAGIWSMTGGGLSLVKAVHLISGLIFPSMYVAGAYMNTK